MDVGMDARYSYMKVEGYNLRYLEQGDRKKDKHILLIHGLGGSIMSWSRNIPYLAEYFHVVALDMLGFGRSDKPRIEYDMQLYVKIIKGVVDNLLGKDKVSIVGSSLGGQIACEFTLSNIDRVDRLVLVSPAGFTPVSFKGTRRLKDYTKIFSVKDVRELRGLLASVHGTPNDEYVEWMYEYINMENAEHAFLSALRNSAKAKRLTRRFKRITESVRTLVIWGKKDEIIPVKYASYFINIDNCRVILLEHCSHRPHVEDSRLFNEYVREFLVGT
jgi:pimeloyl-ACP methyl ester carboxylesterase